MSEAPHESEAGPPERRSPFRSLLGLGGAKLLSTAAQVATTVYLTNVLGPGPFGVLAMVLAFANIVYSLRDAGIGQSLVSDRELTPARRGAALLILGGLGLGLSLLSLLLTPAVLAFYGEQDLLLPWLAVSFLTPFHLLVAIFHALAQRDERFGLIGVAQVLARLGSCFVAVGLCSLQGTPEVWPLIVLYGLPPAITLCVLWGALRPRFALPTRIDVQETLTFAKGIVGFNIAHVLTVNADDILIGQFLGTIALGYYDLCFRIMTFPTRLLTSLVGMVALPRLSVLAKESPAEVAPALARSMRSLGILLGPVAVTISVGAPELIPILFGEKWLPATEAFQLLALLSLVRGVFSIIGLAFTASRDTQALSRWGVVAAPFMILSYALGIPWGILGVAVSQTVVYVALLPVLARFARKVLGDESFVLLVEPAKGMAIGCLIALIPCGALLIMRQAELAPALRLGLTIAVGALAQGVVVLRIRDRIVG